MKQRKYKDWNAWRKSISESMKKVWVKRKQDELDKEELSYEEMARVGGDEKP